jgi:L-glutamine-phosphate cytidylyltransferase
VGSSLGARSSIKALILAAGRGSRMGAQTSNQPKCLTKLRGVALLDWQIGAFNDANIFDLAFVTGYLSDGLNDRGLHLIHNPDWESSNMVHSLMSAKEYITQTTIVSYSDIVFSKDAVELLRESEGDFVLAYDRNWENLWRKRFSNPLDDAESFRLSSAGAVLDIGQKAMTVEEIQGQYMGLFKLTIDGMRWISDCLEEHPEMQKRADMTALIKVLIDRGVEVTALPIESSWCEVDTIEDLEVAEGLVEEGFLHPPSAVS